jgi:hypothetical protein
MWVMGGGRADTAQAAFLHGLPRVGAAEQFPERAWGGARCQNGVARCN